MVGPFLDDVNKMKQLYNFEQICENDDVEGSKVGP